MNIPIPGLKSATGLGDVVQKATTAAGVKPCGGCQKRKEAANAVQFVPWKIKLELPAGYRLKLQGQKDAATQVLLASADTKWAVFLNRDGKLSEGFYGSEAEARAEFDKRMRGTA